MNNKNLLENLRKDFSIFNSFNLKYPKDNNNKDYNFDVLSKLLVNRDFNKVSHNLLNNMYKYYNCNENKSIQVLNERINTRVFLTIYMINFNFDDIISERNKLTLDLEEKSNLVLINFSKLNKYLSNNELEKIDIAIVNKFMEDTLVNIYKFKINFDFYIKKDKKDLLQILLQSHFELKQTLEMLSKKENLSEENKKWLENIPHQIKKVEEKIEKLDPENCKNLIENFQPLMASNESQEDLLKVAQKAYFDILREEILKNKPSNYKKFVVLFCELKDIIKSFIPNRKDIHNELDENINKELLDDLLNNEIQNMINLKDLCFYIIENISKLESQLEDEDTKLWINRLEKDFKNLDNFETNNYYNALLEIYISFIQKSHQKLDRIKNALQRLSKKEIL
jgi:hypothetical protein